MISELLTGLKVTEIILKYVPVHRGFGWFIDKSRLQDVTFERIPLKKRPQVGKYKNCYSIAFLNQVIRSSSKMSRKSIRGGKRAKLIQPQTEEENALIGFHASDKARLKYIGTYNKEITPGVMEEVTNSEIEEQLLKVVTLNASTQKNVIIYLQGNIGCGKSTLLSTLVVRAIIERHKESKQQTKNTLKLDICIVSFEDLNIPENLTSPKDLLDIIYGRILQEILAQVDVSGSTLLDALINARTGRRFTLILDGLDFIYTAFCRLCFELTNDMTLYHNSLNFLISDFTDGQFGDLGIKCIIAFRNETLEVIGNASEEISGVNRINIPRENIYSLHNIPKEKLGDVFALRVSYAAEIEKSAFQAVSTLKSDYFDCYQGIAVHGLRHIMDAWEKAFGFVPLKDVEPRLFRDSRMFKIFFLSSGVRLYSQINHGLTNIFLVNPNFRADSGDITIVDSIDMDRNTYWLKYLMLVYIVENNTDRSTIISLFTGRSSYSAKLIRIILMGFSEVEHGRILKPIIGRFNGNAAAVIGLEPTSRAKSSIKSGLFFSFEYLCCVVEDTYLRVPSSVLSSFMEPLSLKFLTEKTLKKYESGKTEYIKEKARSVITFIMLLEESYKIEKRRDPGLFKVFQSPRYRKYIPNFKRMHADTMSAISELSIDFSAEDKKELKEIIVSSLNLTERELIRRSLAAILK